MRSREVRNYSGGKQMKGIPLLLSLCLLSACSTLQTRRDSILFSNPSLDGQQKCFTVRNISIDAETLAKPNNEIKEAEVRTVLEGLLSDCGNSGMQIVLDISLTERDVQIGSGLSRKTENFSVPRSTRLRGRGGAPSFCTYLQSQGSIRLLRGTTSSGS